MKKMFFLILAVSVVLFFGFISLKDAEKFQSPITTPVKVDFTATAGPHQIVTFTGVGKPYKFDSNAGLIQTLPMKPGSYEVCYQIISPTGNCTYYLRRTTIDGEGGLIITVDGAIQNQNCNPLVGVPGDNINPDYNKFYTTQFCQ